MAYLRSKVNVARKAIKDFTFSDGTTVPAGTFVSVATHSAHFDDVRISMRHELS